MPSSSRKPDGGGDAWTRCACVCVEQRWETVVELELELEEEYEQEEAEDEEEEEDRHHLQRGRQRVSGGSAAAGGDPVGSCSSSS